MYIDAAEILKELGPDELPERLQSAAVSVCTWSQNSHEDIDCSLWRTECQEEFCLNDGDPKENGMKFCCYCGKPLIVSHYFEEDPETGEWVRP